MNTTQFNKTTTTPPSPQWNIESGDIVVHGVYGVIALTSLFGNGITIIIIVRNVAFHTLYNFLLLNLAVADFISGLVTIFGLAYIGSGSQSEIFCQVFTGIIYCNIVVSVYTLTAIAVERYFGIVKPLVHRNNMTSERLKFIVIGVWLCSFIAAFVTARETHIDETTRMYCFLSGDESEWPTWKIVLGWLALFTTLVTPLIVITFLYSKVVMHFIKAKRSPVNENAISSAIANKRSAKVIRLLIFITFVFAIAIIPELVYFAFVLYDRKYVDARLFFKIGIPTVGSIAVNPFVYTLSNPMFREAAKRLVLCRRTRETAPVRVIVSGGGQVKMTRRTDSKVKDHVQQAQLQATSSGNSNH